MKETKPLRIEFPIAGLDKRVAVQKQRPYTCYDSLNVVADGSITERERGGSRAGVGKYSATQIGSGNPVRMLNDVRFVSSGAVVSRLCAVANGTLYYMDSSNVMQTVTSDCTLNSSVQLSSVDYLQKLYIADYGPTLKSGTDGVIGGGSSNQLTSATAGNFASGGVNDDDHFCVITSHTAVNEVQTVTLSATGGYFLLRDETNALTTINIAYNASSATVQTALETIYGTGNVGVSGSAGGPYTVTFQGDLAAQRIDLMTGENAFLTGGSSTVTIARTTRGASTTQYAGTYNITNVATTTLTLHKTMQALTGVTFYVTRCPKVYDPAAGTLTKWIQSDDDDSVPLGAIPVGRTMVTAFNQRLILAGGIYSPHTLDFSRQGDPLDWAVDADDVGAAVLGSVDDRGRIAEPITAILPHQNSCMIISAKTSMWVLRGDITAGAIVNLSEQVGIIDRFAYCQTAEGVLLFMSLTGVYAMMNPCGGTPQSISKEKLPQVFQNIDLSSYTVSMEYCHRYRNAHVWVVQNSASDAGTNYLIDIQLSVHGGMSAAFWPITLGSHNYEPFCVHARRDVPDDYSTVILGGRNGYLRRFQHNLAQDDSTAFTSYVVLGPFQLGDINHRGAVNEIYGHVPASSGDVDWTLYVADACELLVAASSAGTGEWNTVGRQQSAYPRREGQACSVKLANGESNARWEIEYVGLNILPGGRVR